MIHFLVLVEVRNGVVKDTLKIVGTLNMVMVYLVTQMVGGM